MSDSNGNGSQSANGTLAVLTRPSAKSVAVLSALPSETPEQKAQRHQAQYREAMEMIAPLFAEQIADGSTLSNLFFRLRRDIEKETETLLSNEPASPRCR